MNIRVLLFCVALIQLAVVAVVVTKALDEPWRDHQLAYHEQALGRASSAAAKAALASSGLEIRQDVLTGFGELTRVDRCRTCHAAIDDPRFAEGAQPLRTHPKMANHPFGEFGCTICHEGNGRALTAKDAHGQDPFWPEPLLKRPYIEASCARCHPDPYLDETPHLRKGRQLFQAYSCAGCHTIRGKSHGKLGPELTDVGNRFGLKYLHDKLQNPRFNVPMSIMPKFAMPEQDRIDLVVFLKSLRGRALVEDPISVRIQTRQWKEQAPADVAVSAEAGREAVKQRSCTACHKLGDEDGKLAPVLDHVGRLRDEEYIAAHLADPRKHATGSNMPSFWMSDTERRAIAAYLVTLTAVDLPGTPAEQFQALCARCHGERGKGDGVAADNLVPRPRDFTNSRYFAWLPAERAIEAIASGVPGTSMPPFGKILSRPQVEALYGYVKAEFIKATPLPPGARKQALAPASYTPESVESGKAVFQKRCYGCHGRQGNGKGPNAPDMVPRPRDLTSRAFMEKVTDARLLDSITFGVVGTGMPAWDTLPEGQRQDLANYIRFLSRTGPAAPKGAPTGGSK